MQMLMQQDPKPNPNPIFTHCMILRLHFTRSPCTTVLHSPCYSNKSSHSFLPFLKRLP